MITYTSENGYTGKLYGKSSMIILDSEGKEVFHSGSISITTEEELKQWVDDFSNTSKPLLKFYEEMSKGDS